MTTLRPADEAAHLREQLQRASRAYYDLDAPEISDAYCMRCSSVAMVASETRRSRFLRTL